MIKTAIDMVNVARELVTAIDAIKGANQDIQEYVLLHAGEVSLDMLNLTEKLDKAVSLL